MESSCNVSRGFVTRPGVPVECLTVPSHAIRGQRPFEALTARGREHKGYFATVQTRLNKPRLIPPTLHLAIQGCKR